MPVQRNLVSIGQLETQQKWPAAEGIAVQDGDLSPGWETRRSEIDPLQRAVRSRDSFWGFRWRRSGLRHCGDGRIECHAPPAVDLVPDDYVVAGVPDFSARPVVRLGVSAVLRGHGGTRDFDLRRSPVEEESRYPDHVAVHCANRRR